MCTISIEVDWLKSHIMDVDWLHIFTDMISCAGRKAKQNRPTSGNTGKIVQVKPLSNQVSGKTSRKTAKISSPNLPTTLTSSLVNRSRHMEASYSYSYSHSYTYITCIERCCDQRMSDNLCYLRTESRWWERPSSFLWRSMSALDASLLCRSFYSSFWVNEFFFWASSEPFYCMGCLKLSHSAELASLKESLTAMQTEIADLQKTLNVMSTKCICSQNCGRPSTDGD